MSVGGQHSLTDPQLMKHHSSFFLLFSFIFFSISAQNYTIILSMHKHAFTPFSVFGCWIFKERAPRWTFNIAPPNKLILNSFSFTISSRALAFIGMASTLLYAVFSNTTKCGINLTAWIASVILYSSLLGDSVILCASEWIRFCSFIVCCSEMQVPSLCPTTFKEQNCRRAKIK